MDPLFDQASHFLDQALLCHAAGEIEEASQQMANAAATLHAIELAPADSAVQVAAPEMVKIKLKPITVVDFSSVSTAPVGAEAASESSLASAA